MTSVLDTLRSRLEMAPPEDPPPSGWRRAAVLVPLYQVGDQTFLLLTRRTDRVEHHKGQISFPGGAAEPGETLLETALRETYEEVGLPPSQVEVLGTLGEVEVSVSRFLVTPFVGIVPHPYPLRLNADEIDELVLAPLADFLDPARLRVEQREQDGIRVDLYFYERGTHTVWGATARIIKALVDLLDAPTGQ
jgi:8-oxo-dGTP pyrophosphatase MutT (NUDIX family)